MNNMKTQKRNGTLVVWRLVILLLISCVLTACSSDERDNNNTKLLYGFEVQDATDAFYVNDFANIFTEEQKEAMISKAEQLDEEFGGIQVVITTVESLEDTVVRWSAGFEPENLEIYDIAFQMYDQYAIGEDDMGILILFSEGDIDAYLATGYQMQIYITDSDAIRIMYTYGKEEFDNDQFAEWLIALQDGVIQEIRKVVPSNMKGEVATENVANEVTVKVEGKEERGMNLMQVLVGVVVFVFLIIAFVLYRKRIKSEIKTLRSTHASELNKLTKEYQNVLKTEVDQHEREAKLKDSQLESAEKEKLSILDELENTKKELEEKNAFLTRVQGLYPNIEAEVHQMIEDEFKASASEVDERIAKCVDLPADKDNMGVFKEAIDTYNATTSNVRGYVTADISRLSSLYEESRALKEEYDRQEQEKRDRAIASQTCEEISRIFLSNNIGNHENYESLSLAYRKYTSLTSAQIRFFPDKQMLHDLEDTLKEAKKDYDNFNIASEAERKARFIVRGIHHADEDDRDKLKKAHKYYKELSPGQQAYFSNDLLREIKRLKYEADKDHEIQENRRAIERRRREEELHRREEEERRRHAQAQRSSSLSPTFSGPSYNGGSNSHRAGGSSNKPSVGSSHKASTPMKPAVRPSGTSIPRSVNSGHGGKPSGGGAHLGRK